MSTACGGNTVGIYTIINGKYTHYRYGTAIAIAPNGKDITSFTVGSTTTIETTKIKYNTPLGMSGAAGLVFPLSDMLHFTAEINMMAMSAYIKSSTLNGTTINYTKSVTTSGADRATFSVPYSHVGLSIGIMYYLR